MVTHIIISVVCQHVIVISWCPKLEAKFRIYVRTISHVVDTVSTHTNNSTSSHKQIKNINCITKRKLSATQTELHVC